MTTKTPHPWNVIHQHIQDGDEQAAREALRNADERLTGRMRVSADQAIKRSFPPDPPEFKSAADKQKAQDEHANNSELAAAIARRRDSKQRIANRKITGKKYRGSAGDIPMGEEDQYGKPNPGGFNLPVGG
jgi:hypothetical protein